MKKADGKVFEKLRDSVLGEVSGGLETKRPLTTAVLTDDVINIQDTNDIDPKETTNYQKNKFNHIS